MSGLGIFLFAFAILFSIGLHEFGHFITAKKFGIKVHRFFIGFPPKIWSVQKGETEYGIGAIPLGGFVKIAGMNPYEEIEPEDRDRVFKAKPAWQRAIVLAAGSLTHFVLAFVIAFAAFAGTGIEDSDSPTLQVSGVSPDAPAGAAGVREGDILRSIDGVRVSSWDEAVAVIHARPAQTVQIEVLRDGKQVTLTATLASENPQEKGKRVGYLGVGPKFAIKRYGPIAALGEAGRGVGRGITATFTDGLGRVFSPSAISRMLKIVSGKEERTAEDPATIVGITRQAGGLASTRQFGLFLLVIAGFNVFVGIANLLPLPPLDGGHLAVLAFEKVTKRDVDMRKLLPLTAAVIGVLGSIFFLLLFLDIVNPVPAIPG